MIPQISHRLIETRSKVEDVVLDPFCGSGGVITEALLLGRNGIGCDINSLAVRIASAKTTPLDPSKLVSRLESILAGLEDENVAPTYEFKNINHWFNRSVIKDLASIKNSIRRSASDELQVENFFQVCFSFTIRKSSNIRTDDNPYFIRAMVGEELRDYNPDAKVIFEEVARDSIKRMSEFYQLCPKNVSARIYPQDCRNAPIEEGSIDLVVTSPPYGEESHTMSYGRFAKLSLLWMGLSPGELSKAESNSLGGRNVPFRPTSPLLDETYRKVASTNRERAGEMFAFMWDYKEVLKRLVHLLKIGGKCCIVIGDRTVAGVPVPNGNITIELARNAGLSHATSFERDIPKKVLPRKDYKVELINKEHILVFEKVHGDS